MTDYEALAALAEAATTLTDHDGEACWAGTFPHRWGTGRAKDECDNCDAPRYTDSNMAAFIAAANPTTVLALIRSLAAWEEGYPCDGLCSEYPEEDCSRHGRRPLEVWQIAAKEQARADRWERAAIDAASEVEAHMSGLAIQAEKARADAAEAEVERLRKQVGPDTRYAVPSNTIPALIADLRNSRKAFEAIKRDRNAWREESLRARMALREIADLGGRGVLGTIARDALAVALPPEVES